jgi:hypothetical protein
VTLISQLVICSWQPLRGKLEMVREKENVDVLNKIHLMPGDSQPRILGLTASLFASGSLLEVS